MRQSWRRRRSQPVDPARARAALGKSGITNDNFAERGIDPYWWEIVHDTLAEEKLSGLVVAHISEWTGRDVLWLIGLPWYLRLWTHAIVYPWTRRWNSLHYHHFRKIKREPESDTRISPELVARISANTMASSDDTG